MSFSQSAITAVAPPQYRGTRVYLKWTSSAPPGTFFQVYLGGALAWSGQSTRAWLPAPSGPTDFAVGTVAAGEQDTSFAASLDPTPQRRATLAWQGGTYLGSSLAAFRVYRGSAPGAAVVLAGTPAATIAAYPGGLTSDGFGLGGFGAGGLGLAAGSYSWTSDPLAAGPWNFAVVAVDSAGNLGTASYETVSIVAPPRPPAPFAGTSTRLRYSLTGYGQGQFGSGDYSEPTLTLSWNPPPS